MEKQKKINIPFLVSGVLMCISVLLSISQLIGSPWYIISNEIIRMPLLLPSILFSVFFFYFYKTEFSKIIFISVCGIQLAGVLFEIFRCFGHTHFMYILSSVLLGVFSVLLIVLCFKKSKPLIIVSGIILVLSGKLFSRLIIGLSILFDTSFLFYIAAVFMYLYCMWNELPSVKKEKADAVTTTPGLLTRITAVAAGALSIAMVCGNWIKDAASDFLDADFTLFELSEFFYYAEKYLDDSVAGMLEVIITVITYVVIAVAALLIILALIKPRTIKIVSLVLLVVCVIISVATIAAVNSINSNAGYTILATTVNPILLIIFAVFACLSPKIKDGFVLANIKAPKTDAQAEVQDTNTETQVREEKVICKQCGAEILNGNSFCGKCGAPVVQKKKCSNCGYELEEDSLFCGKCGQKTE